MSGTRLAVSLRGGVQVPLPFPPALQTISSSWPSKALQASSQEPSASRQAASASWLPCPGAEMVRGADQPAPFQAA